MGRIKTLSGAQEDIPGLRQRLILNFQIHSWLVRKDSYDVLDIGLNNYRKSFILFCSN